ncbi:hypothetical protein C0J52_23976 [Blattella germanica]|nr:hypothetical protein C0J52_23976 [Blattella germanica]
MGPKREHLRSQIQALHDKIGFGTRAVAKRLNFSDDYQQSQKTIGRTTVNDFIRRQSWGKHAYVQPTKPMLSDKNIVDRQAFCERIMSDGFCDANPEHFLLFGMTLPGNELQMLCLPSKPSEVAYTATSMECRREPAGAERPGPIPKHERRGNDSGMSREAWENFPSQSESDANIITIAEHHVDEGDEDGWGTVRPRFHLILGSIGHPLDKHEDHHVEEEEAEEDDLRNELAVDAHALLEVPATTKQISSLSSRPVCKNDFKNRMYNKSLTLDGSSRGVSISACRRKTLPLQARHNMRSNAGILSRKITPATNLYTTSYMCNTPLQK